jgi:hypothetical protein
MMRTLQRFLNFRINIFPGYDPHDKAITFYISVGVRRVAFGLIDPTMKLGHAQNFSCGDRKGISI